MAHTETLPVQYGIHTNSKKTVNVTLFESDVETICPIMQEPIALVNLEFLTKPFLIDNPTLNGMQLECGHKFHALALTYHWVRNKNMLCPVCRKGLANTTVVVNKLPREWKYSIARRAKREMRQDTLEQVEANGRVAVRLQIELNTQNRLQSSSPTPTNVYGNYMQLEGDTAVYMSPPRLLFDVFFEVKFIDDGTVFNIPCALFPYDDIVLFVASNPIIPDADSFHMKLRRRQRLTITSKMNLTQRNSVIAFGNSLPFSYYGSGHIVLADRGIFELQSENNRVACITFATNLNVFVHTIFDD